MELWCLSESDFSISKPRLPPVYLQSSKLWLSSLKRQGVRSLLSLVFRKGDFSHHQPLWDWGLRGTKWATHPSNKTKQNQKAKAGNFRRYGNGKNLHLLPHPHSPPTHTLPFPSPHPTYSSGWLSSKLFQRAIVAFSGKISQSDKESVGQNGCLDLFDLWLFRISLQVCRMLLISHPQIFLLKKFP